MSFAILSVFIAFFIIWLLRRGAISSGRGAYPQQDLKNGLQPSSPSAMDGSNDYAGSMHHNHCHHDYGSGFDFGGGSGGDSGGGCD